MVSEILPAFFVMENVCGLAYADARGELQSALDLVKEQYDILGPEILDAAEYGAATRRARLFVVGTHKDRCAALTIRAVGAKKRYD